MTLINFILVAVIVVLVCVLINVSLNKLDIELNHVRKPRINIEFNSMHDTPHIYVDDQIMYGEGSNKPLIDMIYVYNSDGNHEGERSMTVTYWNAELNQKETKTISN